jgi:hypothetical protein
MILSGATSLSISAIKTTGTLVVLCTRVLLCSVVVCWCVLLCVVVCKRGGEASLHLCCVRRYSGAGRWLAGLPLSLPLQRLSSKQEIMSSNLVRCFYAACCSHHTLLWVACRTDVTNQFHGVTVSTLDSESSDPSSNLGGTLTCFSTMSPKWKRPEVLVRNVIH